MPGPTDIKGLRGRWVLDSRGNPTVEVECVLEDGAWGRAAVPSGVSTGAHEALELRDGDTTCFFGLSVEGAVENVNGEIRSALKGMNAVAADFGRHGVTTAIVNNGEEKTELQRVYGKHGVTVPIVWDRHGEVSAAYGVDMTPFFFLLDERGKIITRRSYTHGAARNALNVLVGLGGKPPRYESTKAG